MRVLVADDQPDVVDALRLLLKAEGFQTVAATSPAAIVAAVEREEFDAVLMDLNYARDTTSGREGLDLISRLLAIDPTLPIVVMTAWGTVEGAVEAMRRGARDYLTKPWENARLLATLGTQVALGRALRRSRRLEEEASRLRGNRPPFVADSRAMQPVLRMMERIAPSDASVLVTGEHGTGKDVVARWIHESSPRSERSFVAVNSGGLSEGVFESELFGHVRGAFTDAKADRVGCFELADGGTLFLDEIANMPASQQAKLLRTLQTGEFRAVGSSKTRTADVRVISATNADIRQEVAAGRFREDLLYRLNTVEIHLPPLRDRREDIPALASRFLQEQAQRYGRGLEGFTPEAMRALVEHRWPGNVRELQHVVERAVLLAEGRLVAEHALALRGRAEAPALDELSLEQAERHLIERALEKTGGKVVSAARLLGLSRSALYRRLQHFGIKGEP